MDQIGCYQLYTVLFTVDCQDSEKNSVRVDGFPSRRFKLCVAVATDGKNLTTHVILKRVYQESFEKAPLSVHFYDTFRYIQKKEWSWSASRMFRIVEDLELGSTTQ